MTSQGGRAYPDRVVTVVNAISAYLDFVHTAPGGVTVVALSLAACAGLVLWAFRGAREERRTALVVAGTLTGVVVAAYLLAVAAGWWVGAYFETPLLVQAAVLLPISVAGWLVWLMGYFWLAARSRYPLRIYTVLALLLISAAAVADRANIAGGLVIVAGDGMVWIDALIGGAVMLAPLLLFEGLRRGLERDVLP